MRILLVEDETELAAALAAALARHDAVVDHVPSLAAAACMTPSCWTGDCPTAMG